MSPISSTKPKQKKSIRGVFGAIGANGAAPNITTDYHYGAPMGYVYYRCKASGYGGETVSDAVAVYLAYPLPAFTIAYARADTSITYTATSYYSEYGIQWQKYNDEKKTWVDIAGETKTSFAVKDLDKTYNGTYLYRCKGSGIGGEGYSDVQTIEINHPKPVINSITPVGNVTWFDYGTQYGKDKFPIGIWGMYAGSTTNVVVNATGGVSIDWHVNVDFPATATFSSGGKTIDMFYDPRYAGRLEVLTDGAPTISVKAKSGGQWIYVWARVHGYGGNEDTHLVRLYIW